MRHILKAALMAASICAAGPTAGQESIVWRETLNLPKGLNLPSGVSADILGVAVGESYAEARPKLQALLAESQPPHGFDDRSITITMQSPSTSARVQATFPGEIHVRRRLPGSGAARIREEIVVHFSAPSSGSQVLGIKRTLHYEQPDEPRVSDLMKRLSEKFGGPPQVFNHRPDSTEYRFQFNDGQLFTPPRGTLSTDCFNWHVIESSQNLPLANRTGTCDVLLTVSVNHGISPDHARELIFHLSDNQRARENVGADYAFFEAYLNELANRSRGVAPRL